MTYQDFSVINLFLLLIRFFKYCRYQVHTCYQKNKKNTHTLLLQTSRQTIWEYHVQSLRAHCMATVMCGCNVWLNCMRIVGCVSAAQPKLAVVNKTFGHAVDGLSHFLIVFFVVMVVFSIQAQLIYGDPYPQRPSRPESVSSLLID
eukprot:COSAG01_NODE_2747_length_7149_cov_5.321844_11_plen_146_part_00